MLFAQEDLQGTALRALSKEIRNQKAESKYTCHPLQRPAMHAVKPKPKIPDPTSQLVQNRQTGFRGCWCVAGANSKLVGYRVSQPVSSAMRFVCPALGDRDRSFLSAVTAVVVLGVRVECWSRVLTAVHWNSPIGAGRIHLTCTTFLHLPHMQGALVVLTYPCATFLFCFCRSLAQP